MSGFVPTVPGFELDRIASLERWGKRDAMGQKLMTFVERMDSPAPREFRILLREPGSDARAYHREIGEHAVEVDAVEVDQPMIVLRESVL